MRLQQLHIARQLCVSAKQAMFNQGTVLSKHHPCADNVLELDAVMTTNIVYSPMCACRRSCKESTTWSHL